MASALLARIPKPAGSLALSLALATSAAVVLLVRYSFLRRSSAKKSPRPPSPWFWLPGLGHAPLVLIQDRARAFHSFFKSLKSDIVLLVSPLTFQRAKREFSEFCDAGEEERV
jgi:hypothetical protein